MRAVVRRCSLAIAVSFTSANRANKCQIVWNTTGIGGGTHTHPAVLWSVHTVTADRGIAN